MGSGQQDSLEERIETLAADLISGAGTCDQRDPRSRRRGSGWSPSRFDGGQPAAQPDDGTSSCVGSPRHDIASGPGLIGDIARVVQSPPARRLSPAKREVSVRFVRSGILSGCVWVCHDEFRRRCASGSAADTGSVVVPGVACCAAARQGCVGSGARHVVDGRPGLAAVPAVQAVDALTSTDPSTVLFWSAALVATGTVLALLGIWRHRTMTQVRMDAAFGRCCGHGSGGRMGDALGRWSRAGEVVALGIGMCGRSVAVSP